MDEGKGSLIPDQGDQLRLRMTDSYLGYPRVWNDTVTGAAAVGNGQRDGEGSTQAAKWEENSRMHDHRGCRAAKVVAG